MGQPPRLRAARVASVAVRPAGRGIQSADLTEGRHGFPAALTSFVGRFQVVDEIAAQLGQCRLVTVTGPAGAGKTRLAGEVARQVADRFADGVWLAELAALTDPAQVAATVGTALGIRDLPSVAAADALAQALARRQLLLVLDNCEHVIGAAAELCGRLLLGADEVRVLATSLEPLRIAGEVRYRLGPLALPGDATGDCEAVTLFADRARRAEPGFVLDEETGAAVAELVARPDGGGLSSQAPLLAAAVEYAEVGSDEWCSARMFLGQVVGEAEDPPAMLKHFTAVRDALDDPCRRGTPGTPVLLSVCLVEPLGTVSQLLTRQARQQPCNVLRERHGLRRGWHVAANPLVNLGWTRYRTCVRMGNLDRRHQMADVNDLESTLLEVCNSFLVEVVSEEGSMDQRDSPCFQRPEAGSCRGCRHEDRNTI
jgi:AAA domain